MKYERIVQGQFIARLNRFVAEVRLDGEVVPVHVKNTGRCRELLIPGAAVWLEDFRHRPGKRKLLFDLVAVDKGGLLINMDSQAPNKAVREALESGSLTLPGMDRLTLVKPETTWGSSRFDFYAEDAAGRRAFIEVKGVTLENSGIAAFPDAPTERGIKHLRELIEAKNCGFSAYILFVIQMEGMKLFTPNYATHPAFGEALCSAVESGVQLIVRECNVTPDSMYIAGDVPYSLAQDIQEVIQ